MLPFTKMVLKDAYHCKWKPQKSHMNRLTSPRSVFVFSAKQDDDFWFSERLNLQIRNNYVFGNWALHNKFWEPFVFTVMRKKETVPSIKNSRNIVLNSDRNGRSPIAQLVSASKAIRGREFDPQLEQVFFSSFFFPFDGFLLFSVVFCT